MPNFLADTSFLIDIINDRNGRREFLRELLQPGDTIGCCTINWIEIYTGMRPGEERSASLRRSSGDSPITTSHVRSRSAPDGYAMNGGGRDRRSPWRMPRSQRLPFTKASSC
ncbi:MAG: hypothetical protein ABSC05_13025 [Candidatus Solibacter sp.]|jgi:hypothetical protein